MAFDPYGPCPCGSAKKFKWCCHPIHVDIDKAYRQHEQRQHDSPFLLMQLLYQNDQVEAAEKALDKALELNPRYPFGHFLRGIFRQYEGEIPGALVEFRKAAELYDPEARDILAQVFGAIGESEMRLNRPVAARAALAIARRYRPADESLQKLFQALFGEDSGLPTTGRQEYAYLPLDSNATTYQDSWERALSGAATGKLMDASAAFESLTKENPQLPAGWYNLGLTRAWLGDNPAALKALNQYVNLTPAQNPPAATSPL